MNSKSYLTPLFLFALSSTAIETLGLLWGLYEYPLSIVHIGIVPLTIVLYWSLIGLVSFLAYRRYGWKVGIWVGLLVDIPAEVVAYYSGVWRWNHIWPPLFTLADAPDFNFLVYIIMSMYAILIYRYFVKQ